MSDRELVELAANAAGIVLDRTGNKSRNDPQRHAITCKPWRPLEDDGDALRLAVVRKILRCHMDLFHKFYEEEIANGLKEDAATRRAIVRAVATLGECAKPPSPN